MFMLITKDNILFFLYFYMLYAVILPFPLLVLYFCKIIYQKIVKNEKNKKIKNTISSFNINKKYTDFLIKNVLNVSYSVLNVNKRIDDGIIIANHKSGFDNIYDSHVTDSALLGDKNIKYYHALYYILQYFHRVIILFDKRKTNRHNAYKRMDNHKNKYNINRMLFYPEGTRIRNSYESKQDIANTIKYGLLKSIYEKKEYCVQLFISKNKEFPFKNYSKKPIFVQSIYGEPIFPKDFETFEDFTGEIIEQWFTYLQKL
jgi:hypothetical protein